ncbi:MAG: hypothetical protein QF473_09545 [Planctomycetota bacterium]|jgi:flagellar biosynthesis regulator FlbT|nr:hypothetical protein [Planctomycetota bacterium]MDP6502684.1 hypothetical protein [Planctomycetota bacterium]
MPKKLLIAIICSEILLTGVFLIWRDMNRTKGEQQLKRHADRYVHAVAESKERKQTPAESAEAIFNLRMAQAWNPDDPSYATRISKHEALLLRTLGSQDRREVADRIAKLKKSLDIEDSPAVRTMLKEFDAIHAAREIRPETPLSQQYRIITEALRGRSDDKLQNRLTMMVARVRVRMALEELESIPQIDDRQEMLQAFQALRESFRNRPIDENTVLAVEETMDRVDKVEQASRASGSVPAGEGPVQAQALLEQLERTILLKLREAETSIE